MSNRLAHESSAYLRQHAHNPVDWYPWGDEAFARARAEDKPLLVSVGYSACHWCHVMERESFEDAETARLMNEWFVPVKVDREERPDVDAVYMQATQAMTGHGGWPMTVFATPDGVPFYCGTYFPPEDRHGMPSFRRILATVADAWRARRGDVDRTADALRAMYAETRRAAVASGPLTSDTLVRAVRAVARVYDREHGGTRGAPKFPQAMTSDFLLRRWARTGDESLLTMALHTFTAMARGGTYDQVGGGFHRYSVDAQWRVPHFEKMLYDNALLVSLGTRLWQATASAEARRVTEETLTWLRREMTAPGGAFHATLDADSEGEEGLFYTWTASELRDVLGTDYDAVAAYWGVTRDGNFEGRNVLFAPLTDGPAAEEGDDSALADAVRRARPLLLAARSSRTRPARDEKIVAAWNGLMLRAVAEAARAFGAAEWRAMAVANAEALLASLVDGEAGRVARVQRTGAGGTERLAGTLEDHSAVALGLLAVYALTGARRWLDVAARIGDTVVAAFWDGEVGAFFDTPTAIDDAAPLPARPRDASDNATPSGTSLAVELLLTLAALLDPSASSGRRRFRRIADHALETLAEPMARHAPAFGHLLGAADLAVDGAIELVLVGDPAAPDFGALAAAAGATYAPSLVVAVARPDEPPAPLAAGRPALSGRATAYVCRGGVCDRPTTDPATLVAQLRQAAPEPGSGYRVPPAGAL